MALAFGNLPSEAASSSTVTRFDLPAPVEPTTAQWRLTKRGDIQLRGNTCCRGDTADSDRSGGAASPSVDRLEVFIGDDVNLVTNSRILAYTPFKLPSQALPKEHNSHPAIAREHLTSIFFKN